MTDATRHSSARLHFLSDWRIIKQGEILPNAPLIIEYDTKRLPNFRKKWRDADVWNMEIHVRFHPDGQLHKGSLLEEVRDGVCGPVVDYLLKPFEIVTPQDAVQAELWFYTFDNVSGFREAWDSQFGRNYWFDVVRE